MLREANMTIGTGARTVPNIPRTSTQGYRIRKSDRGQTSARNAKKEKTTKTAQQSARKSCDKTYSAPRNLWTRAHLVWFPIFSIFFFMRICLDLVHIACANRLISIAPDPNFRPDSILLPHLRRALFSLSDAYSTSGVVCPHILHTFTPAVLTPRARQSCWETWGSQSIAGTGLWMGRSEGRLNIPEKAKMKEDT